MITAKHLSYTYAKHPTPALLDLSFTIEPGEIFGFLGPSGAGKSTTQKILIGLLKAYQGQIEVLGTDLAAWRSDYYERIGVCFELPNHFLKLTALENLSYFRALYSRSTHDPRAVLELVGLQDDADQPVGQFSKGMQARLNLARALLHDPELLFLDEPTTGQDPVNARRVKQLIRAQRDAGKTVVLTTHDMSVAEELCDRVAFIMNGAIALIDTPRNLKLHYGMPQVRVEYRGPHRTAHAEFALHGLGENADFLSLLQRTSVQTIHSQEATLEDVVVRVTGRGLE
jgi:fluoroquinolone transport system ATP-binding protein